MSEGRTGLGGIGHRGIRSAKAGIYVKVSTWEWTQHPGGLLPGTERDRYLRVPAPLVLVLGPLLGALYVVGLSFIGFLSVACFLGRRIARAVMALLVLAAETVFPTWVPGRSYLVRYGARQRRAEGIGKRDLGSQIEELAREIEKKRRKGD